VKALLADFFIFLNYLNNGFLFLSWIILVIKRGTKEKIRKEKRRSTLISRGEGIEQLI